MFCPPEICALVLGPPRSGKTTSVIIPNVVMARGSVISVSTKSDVLEATFSIRRRTGRCFVFDPTEALDEREGVDRIGWSPLHSALVWEHAVLCADAMVGASSPNRDRESSHWLERASALLSALFHAAALDGAQMDQVVRAVHRRDPEQSLASLARHDANFALDLLLGITETDAREQSGIWSSASGVLSAYRTGAALRAAALPALDCARFINEPTTLYIASPAEHQQHVAPLVAGLLRDVRSHAYSASMIKQVDGKAPVLLVLDELANIAPLHDLPALIAEGASQGILTLASLQDLSQARSRWGIAGEGFISLFGAKLILAGIGDRQTLEGLSLLAGDHYVNVTGTSHRRHLLRWTGAATQRSVVRERRLTPDAIASPPPGTATAVIGAQAFHLKLTPYHRAYTRSRSDERDR